MPLNESPSEKEGKFSDIMQKLADKGPSMKVPPKRKGNHHRRPAAVITKALNESPSEKEGKFQLKEPGYDRI